MARLQFNQIILDQKDNFLLFVCGEAVAYSYTEHQPQSDPYHYGESSLVGPIDHFF